MSVAESKPSPPAATRLKREELFSFYSHLTGAACAVVGTVVLAVLSRTTAGVTVSLVYGVSMVFMFGASAAYHALKDTQNGESFWRRVDHLAIFFMIAGSYTPICWFHLSGAWRWSMLGTQWGLVFLGAVFKLLFLGAPRWVTAAIYVIMGWVVVIPFNQLLTSWDVATPALLGAGGIAYTVGAVIYALKRPDPIPGFFGFHEVFHVAVVLGAGIHYIAIFRIVT
jgi:hemolysin III